MLIPIAFVVISWFKMLKEDKVLRNVCPPE